jgi:2,3-dihydroxyphenylpropionate 1,2-dioxygenase
MGADVDRGEQRVLEAGKQYAAGTSTRIPLNPEWDNVVLDTIASGDLRAFDAWAND